jgi:hypothetical protein
VKGTLTDWFNGLVADFYDKGTAKLVEHQDYYCMPPDDGSMIAAITSEKEKKNCCADGPIIAFLIRTNARIVMGDYVEK